jgi:hypothetical protein
MFPVSLFSNWGIRSQEQYFTLSAVKWTALPSAALRTATPYASTSELVTVNDTPEIPGDPSGFHHD